MLACIGFITLLEYVILKCGEDVSEQIKVIECDLGGLFETAVFFFKADGGVGCFAHDKLEL